MDSWYYAAFGSEFGPVTFDELIELAKKQHLTATDMVKLGPEGKWRNVGSIGRLVAHLPFQLKGILNLDSPRPAKLTVCRREESYSVRTEEAEVPTKAFEGSSRPHSKNTASISQTLTDVPTASGKKAAQWWCRVGGVEYGPVDKSTLHEWVSGGQLHPTDELRNDSGEEYVSASTYPEFFPTLRRAAAAKKSPPVRTSGPGKSTVPVRNREISSEPTKEHTAVRTKPDVPIAAAQPAKSAKIQRTDDDLSQEINGRIAGANIASFAGVKLDVRQGTITVRGDLVSEGERLLLLRLLQQTSGYVAINDELKVVPRQPITPAATRAVMASPKAFRPTPKSSAVSRLFESLKVMHAIIAGGVLLIVGSAVLVVQASSSNGHLAVYQTKGSITLDGKPMPKAILVLNPATPSAQGEKGPYIRAIADADGNFAISTYGDKDGAPAGDYVATVTWSKPDVSGNGGTKSYGSNACPSIYLKPETSPLKFTIKKERNDLGVVELKTAVTK